jgi:hypothetical protein
MFTTEQRMFAVLHLNIFQELQKTATELGMGKSSIGRWSKELENVQHQGDLLVSVHLPRQKYSELGRNHREDRSVCDHSQAQMDPTGYSYPCHCPLFTDV